MNTEKRVRNPGANSGDRPMRKTYGISGLTEITVAIPVGKTWLNVHFTGGAITGYGVVPATFTTENVSLQRLIELSPQFRSMKIKIVSKRAL